jgi:hypothetical protein
MKYELLEWKRCPKCKVLITDRSVHCCRGNSISD